MGSRLCSDTESGELGLYAGNSKSLPQPKTLPCWLLCMPGAFKSEPWELRCAQVRQSSGLSGLRLSARGSGSSVAGGLGGSPPLASPGY